MKAVGLLLLAAFVVLAAEVSTNQIEFTTKWADTNQIQLILTNKKKIERTRGDYTFHEMDYTATNLLLQSSHEPIFLGKTNGVWLIGFR